MGRALSQALPLEAASHAWNTSSCDAQSRVQDAAGLTALIQCLVRRHAQAPAHPAVAPELLEENRSLAARDSIDAKLIDHRSGVRRPARDILDEMPAACEPFADGLGAGASDARPVTGSSTEREGESQVEGP